MFPWILIVGRAALITEWATCIVGAFAHSVARRCVDVANRCVPVTKARAGDVYLTDSVMVLH